MVRSTEASTCVQTATETPLGSSPFLSGPNGRLGLLAPNPAKTTLVDILAVAKGLGSALDTWTRPKPAAEALAGLHKRNHVLGREELLMSSALCPRNQQNGLNGLHAPGIAGVEIEGER